MNQEIIYPIPPTRKGYNVVVMRVLSESRVHVRFGYCNDDGVMTTYPDTDLTIDASLCKAWRQGYPRYTISFPHHLLTDGNPNHAKVREFVGRMLDL
jgi:hypothetical protein